MLGQKTAFHSKHPGGVISFKLFFLTEDIKLKYSVLMSTFYFLGGGHNNCVIVGIANLKYAPVSWYISDHHPSACNKFNISEGIFMKFHT